MSRRDDVPRADGMGHRLRGLSRTGDQEEGTHATKELIQVSGGQLKVPKALEELRRDDRSPQSQAHGRVPDRHFQGEPAPPGGCGGDGPPDTSETGFLPHLRQTEDGRKGRAPRRLGCPRLRRVQVGTQVLVIMRGHGTSIGVVIRGRRHGGMA